MKKLSKLLQYLFLGGCLLQYAACSPSVTQSPFEEIPSIELSVTQDPTSEIPSPSPTTIMRKVSERDGMVLLLVLEGSFVMGGGTEIDERYKHEVFINTYWIDQTEVTIGMYAACVENGECTPPRRNDSLSREHYYDDPSLLSYPVIQVTWFQAKAYCEWVNRRLPTEAEWEKAARGVDERSFPWGEDQDCSFANYWGENEKCVGGLVAVASYPDGQSPYGAYEMAGNAYEWVADWYDSGYYTRSKGENPLGPETGKTRVVRGGSFLHLPRMMYTYSRNNFDPSIADVFTGFRCAQTP